MPLIGVAGMGEWFGSMLRARDDVLSRTELRIITLLI